MFYLTYETEKHWILQPEHMVMPYDSSLLHWLLMVCKQEVVNGDGIESGSREWPDSFKKKLVTGNTWIHMIWCIW